MAKIKAVNYLKLTAGFDVSGNDDIDYYAARSYFSASQFLETIAGLSFASIGNTKIQWETTRRFNVGLETNLFNNRVNLYLGVLTAIYLAAYTLVDCISVRPLGYIAAKFLISWVTSTALCLLLALPIQNRN